MFSVQRFDKIVLGFLFFFIGGMVETRLGSPIAMVPIKLVGWYYIISGFMSVKRGLGCNGLPSKYLNLVRFYILLCVIMIARGYMIDYQYPWLSKMSLVNYHLFSNHYILPFLMPLALCIPISEIKYDNFVKYAKWVAVVGILLFVVYFRDIVESSYLYMLGYDDGQVTGESFSIYASFAFAALCFHYIPKKTWFINLAGLVVTLLILLISARRGGSAIMGMVLVVCLYYYRKTTMGTKKFLITVFLAICFAAAIYYILHSAIFSYILDRGMEDTRSNVEDTMLEQMDTFQLIFGKGLNGRYYLPMLYNDQWNGYRYIVETGFYNFVLKGGYLLAITYVLVIAIPAYNGLLKSNNMLCRAGGFYLLISIIHLYPAGFPTFDMWFFIIWTLISLCMSKQIRSMNDSQIKQLFFSNI